MSRLWLQAMSGLHEEAVLERSARPWARRAIRKLDRYGPYADYAAWAEWLGTWMERYAGGCAHAEWKALGDRCKAMLYSLMCAMVDSPGAVCHECGFICGEAVCVECKLRRTQEERPCPA